jgi:very-short-patch-repair endonuclease
MLRITFARVEGPEWLQEVEHNPSSPNDDDGQENLEKPPRSTHRFGEKFLSQTDLVARRSAKKIGSWLGCTVMATRLYSPHMLQRARKLRRDSTPEEEAIWQRVRGSQLGLPIRRQHPIDGVIVDFYCPRAKVAIELDGAHHNPEKDARRDRILSERGILVLRFENNVVRNDPNGVIAAIKKLVSSRADLLRAGGENVDDVDVDE